MSRKPRASAGQTLDLFGAPLADRNPVPAKPEVPPNDDAERVLGRVLAAAREMRARGVAIGRGEWGIGKLDGKWVLTGRSCCALAAFLVVERVKPGVTTSTGHPSCRADAARALGVDDRRVNAFIAGFDGTESHWYPKDPGQDAFVEAGRRAHAELQAKPQP